MKAKTNLDNSDELKSEGSGSIDGLDDFVANLGGRNTCEDLDTVMADCLVVVWQCLTPGCETCYCMHLCAYLVGGSRGISVRHAHKVAAARLAQLRCRNQRLRCNQCV